VAAAESQGLLLPAYAMQYVFLSIQQMPSRDHYAVGEMIAGADDGQVQEMSHPVDRAEGLALTRTQVRRPIRPTSGLKQSGGAEHEDLANGYNNMALLYLGLTEPWSRVTPVGKR